MKSRKVTAGWRSILCGFGLLAATAIGCQSDIAGQTLPSGYYLRDDVQFFPAGPETQLPEQRRVLQQYRARQAGNPDAAPDPIQ